MTEAVCPACKGRGFLAYDVAYGDPRFRRLQACRCTLARRQGEMFPGLLAAMTLDSFKARTAKEELALAVARGAVGKWQADRPGSLGFYSPVLEPPVVDAKLGTISGYGCGKTMLAVGLAKEALALGRSVQFVKEAELFEAFKRSFGDDGVPSVGDLLAEMSDAWLLVLDDVGTYDAKSLGWYRSLLGIIVDHCYTAAQPLVLTTNLAPNQLAERVGGRVWSRLQGMLEFFHLDGPDRRVR